MVTTCIRRGDGDMDYPLSPSVSAPEDVAGTESPVRERRRAPVWAAIRWAIISLVLLIVAAPHLLTLTGHRIIAVDGGSMAPTYQPGDVLLTGPPTGDDLQVGRILVVGVPPTLYTHRVIDVRRSGDGAGEARLRGDANTTPDPGWVSQDDVFAIPVLHLAQPAATLVTAVTSTPGMLVLAGIGAVLLLSASRRSHPKR